MLASAAEVISAPPTLAAPTTVGATTTSGTVAPAWQLLPAKVIRVSGVTRIQTAIAASLDEFPSSGSAKAVVLARSDAFPDALAGGPLAAKVGGPLLLTPPSGLDPATRAEIRRVAPPGSTVYLLGSTAALQPAVDAAITELGDKPQRIFGTDRFATAVAIAGQLGDPTTVFEATGLDFPDALAAGPAAITAGGAILLTNGTQQAPTTAAYLKAHPGGLHYALGGAAAKADPAATAFIGTDRYDTAAQVADQFFPKPTTVGATTGLNFPDALSAGPDLASKGAPLLLVPGGGDLPQAPAIEMLADAATLTSAVVFGSSAAVDDGIATQLGQFAGLSPATAALSSSGRWTGQYGVLSEHQVTGPANDVHVTIVADGNTGDLTTYQSVGTTAVSPDAVPTRAGLDAMRTSAGGFEKAVNDLYGAGYTLMGYSFPTADAEFAITAQPVIEDPVASPSVRALVLVTLANLSGAHLNAGAHDSTGRVAVDVWLPIVGNALLAGFTIHYLFDPATATPLEVKRLDPAGVVVDQETYLSFSTTGSLPSDPYAASPSPSPTP